MPIRLSVPLFSVLLLATFALGFLTGNFYPKKLFAPPLTVVRVIDGDTVELSDHRHLRLRGVNAPELNKHECLAEEAKSRLEQLLLNKAITIEATTAVVDSFGRTVAVITLKGYRGEGYQLPKVSRAVRLWTSLKNLLLSKGADERLATDSNGPSLTIPPREESRGTFEAVPEPPSDTSDRLTISPSETSSEASGQAAPEPPTTDPALILVSEGLARSAGPFPSAAYQEKVFTLEETAKDAGLGLWNPDACPQPTPVPANCNIKGNIHWKKRQKLYFPPDCTGYQRVTIEPRNGDRAFCSVDDAEAAGFTLSSTCEEE